MSIPTLQIDVQPNEPETPESVPNDQNFDRTDALNVLLVIGDLGFGGAERQVLMPANGWARLGHNVHIAIFSNFAPLASALIEPSRLHLLPGRSPWALFRLARRLHTQVLHGFLIDAEILCCLAVRLLPRAVAIGSERSSRHDYAWWQDFLYRSCTTNMKACIANSDEGLR